jgi:hypothetical protein
MLSGPQNQPQTPKTPTSASTIQTFSFVNQKYRKTKREKVRKETESLLKKFRK